MNKPRLYRKPRTENQLSGCFFHACNKYTWAVCLLLAPLAVCQANSPVSRHVNGNGQNEAEGSNDLLYVVNNSDWKDTDNNPILAHDGGISQFNGTYYWYGSDYPGNPWGIYGINAYTDQLNSESKKVVDVYEDILRMTAEHQLMVDFHGANKPTDEVRTWPHEITREGIREQEYLLWGQLPLPDARGGTGTWPC